MDPIGTKEASPWHPRPTARALLAWSGPQLAQLGAALGRALAQWRDAWGMAPESGELRCEAATSDWVVRDGWRMLGDAGCAAWLHVPQNTAATLGAVLFGEVATPASAGVAVAGACAQDAIGRLAAALGLTAAEDASGPPPAIGTAWSGAVQVVLPGSPGWLLLLSAEAMQSWCSRHGLRAQDTRGRTPREVLCTADEAMGSRPVALTVDLSGCDIDLGTLQSLRIGDVVRLRHDLQSPARLTDAEGRPVFDGFLVAHRGRKAIELVQPQTH
jgi:hypothetical protein